VRVTLPAASEVADVKKNPSLRAGPLSRELRILIVDDDPLVRRSMQRTLRDHAVTLATSGRDAIERVRCGERFDLILCDVMMPELTGIDVHDHIAAIDENVARRIVFLTGGAFAEATATRLEQLPNERCFKPIDASKMNELLRMAESQADDFG
jgi:CheY-like chemotaxis protein